MAGPEKASVAECPLQLGAEPCRLHVTVCSFSVTSNRSAAPKKPRSSMMLANLCAAGLVAPCGALQPGFPEITGLVDHENQIVSLPHRASRSRDPSGWRYAGACGRHYVRAGAADPRRAESHSQDARDAPGSSRTTGRACT